MTGLSSETGAATGRQRCAIALARDLSTRASCGGHGVTQISRRVRHRRHASRGGHPDAKTATVRIRVMSAPEKGYDRWAASIVE
jgi:hypothetical protein